MSSEKWLWNIPLRKKEKMPDEKYKGIIQKTMLVLVCTKVLQHMDSPTNIP